MLEGTVRQNQIRPRPSLAIHTQGAASSTSLHSNQHSDGPTPIALPTDDDDDDAHSFELPQAPFGQQLRAKASYDSLSSNPTAKSQISIESRPKEAPRKPAGNPGEGLRGFQFPLNKAMMPSRPAPLQRGASAAPTQSAMATLGVHDSLSPTRPGLPRMQSAQPNLQTESPNRNGKPQISINLPPRPQMMRTASAAVLGGRAQAQAQAQAQALASVVEGPVSPDRSNLGVPNRPAIGLGVAVGMSRSRSGSKVDDVGVGLRDLMRVSYITSLNQYSLTVYGNGLILYL